MWKNDLGEDEIQNFVIEFAKLIYRLRCNDELLFKDNDEHWRVRSVYL